MNVNRQTRVEAMNELLEVLSNESEKVKLRPLFRYEGFQSKFEIASRGQLIYVDEYTQKSINPYSRHWNKFNHGGTMKALVQCMAEFIKTGEPTTYGCLYVPFWGSAWTMERRQNIIDAGVRLGYIKDGAPTYQEYLDGLEDWEKAYAPHDYVRSVDCA